MNSKSTLIVALAVSAFSPQAALAQRHHNAADVVQNISRDSRYNTLTAALKAAGLVEALQEAKAVTILAPNNAAFAKLPKGTLAKLLRPENREQLRRILQYHVVAGSLRASALAKGTALTSLAGPSITVTRDKHGRTLFDGRARFRGINYLSSNGFVQEIDHVLMPPTKNLVETAQAAGGFKTLIAAVRAAGLSSVLAGKRQLTILAPNDQAFAKLGRKTLQSLLRPENSMKLRAILKQHVLPGRVSAVEDVAARTSPSLLRSARVNFGLVGGRISVQNASVIANDVQASNGVIHVIDTVLMPPKSLLPQPSGRKIVGYYSGRPSAALAAQLGIDAAKTTLVTSTTKNGPARRAGLAKHDVIVSINGRTGSSKDLARAKSEREVGEAISFVVLRAGKRKHIDIPLAFDRH